MHPAKPAIGIWLGMAGLWLATLPALADGSDCCADLEERIADLEATTARKGNRKVSLTVSGWINEALFAWDDGTQHNVYSGTNMVEQSRVKFLGEAKIDKDLSAGYLLEIAVQTHVSNQWSQLTDKSLNGNPANQDDRQFVRKSYWFLKSKQFGQVAVGLNGMATYHLLDDADPTLTRNVDDAEGPPIFMSTFYIRSNGNFVNGLRWPDVLRGFNTQLDSRRCRAASGRALRLPGVARLHAECLVGRGRNSATSVSSPGPATAPAMIQAH